MMADILETQEQEEEPTSTSTPTAINNKMEDVIKLPTLTTTTTATDIFRPPPPKLRIIGPPIYQKGVCGLLNLGNTCFMNSAIQCLSNLPDLTDYFLSEDEKYKEEINEQNPLGTKGKLVNAYAELLRDMWSGQSSSVRPFKLKLVIGRLVSHFSGYTQQDSQELTAFLLDGLHEDLNRIKEKPYTEVNENDEGPSNPHVAWQEYLKRNDSIIVDLMHGQLKSTLTCSCKKVSIKFDPFCFLSIPIPANEYEIKTATAKSVSSDQLMGGEQPTPTVVENGDLRKNDHCIENGITTTAPMEDAQPQQIAKISLSQQNLLEYSYGFISWLIFILGYINPLKVVSEMVKNFFSTAIPLETCLKFFFSIDHLCGEDKYSCEHCKTLRNGTKHSSITRLPQILIIHLKRFRHEGAYNTKLRTRISFPLYNLDMTPFMHPDSLRDAKGHLVQTKYDLCGVISHRGQNMEYGHYVAYCRNAMDAKWYEFDDSLVTRVSPIEVASQEVYVLFYERKDATFEEEEEDEFFSESFEDEAMKTADEDGMEDMETEEEQQPMKKPEPPGEVQQIIKEERQRKRMANGIMDDADEEECDDEGQQEEKQKEHQEVPQKQNQKHRQKHQRKQQDDIEENEQTEI